MRLLTLNLRHGGGARVPALLDVIASHDADAVVLTEFRMGRSGQALLDGLAGRGWVHAAHSEPATRTNGVLVASRASFRPVPTRVTRPEWRRHWVEVEFDRLRLVGVYFPLGRPKLPFWAWFMEPAMALASERALLLGDFNTGKHRLDETGVTFFGPEYIDRLEALGYVDAWRAQHPDARDYTWFSARGNGFRVDHAFASRSLAPAISSARHSHAERDSRVTDHSGLVIELRD